MKIGKVVCGETAAEVIVSNRTEVAVWRGLEFGMFD